MLDAMGTTTFIHLGRIFGLHDWSLLAVWIVCAWAASSVISGARGQEIDGLWFAQGEIEGMAAGDNLPVFLSVLVDGDHVAIGYTVMRSGPVREALDTLGSMSHEGVWAFRAGETSAIADLAGQVGAMVINQGLPISAYVTGRLKAANDGSLEIGGIERETPIADFTFAGPLGDDRAPMNGHEWLWQAEELTLAADQGHILLTAPGQSVAFEYQGLERIAWAQHLFQAHRNSVVLDWSPVMANAASLAEQTFADLYDCPGASAYLAKVRAYRAEADYVLESIGFPPHGTLIVSDLLAANGLTIDHDSPWEAFARLEAIADAAAARWADDHGGAPSPIGAVYDPCALDE